MSKSKKTVKVGAKVGARVAAEAVRQFEASSKSNARRQWVEAFGTPADRPLNPTDAKEKKTEAKPEAKPVFGGRVYGSVFEFAQQQKAMPTRELVAMAASALGLPERDVGFAVAVLRQANHPTNKGRAWNASEERGITMIRRYRPTKVPVDRKPKVKATPKAAVQVVQEGDGKAA